MIPELLSILTPDGRTGCIVKSFRSSEDLFGIKFIVEVFLTKEFVAG